MSVLRLLFTKLGTFVSSLALDNTFLLMRDTGRKFAAANGRRSCSPRVTTSFLEREDSIGMIGRKSETERDEEG